MRKRRHDFVELVPAQLYTDELKSAITNCWYNEAFQYYFGEYQGMLKIDTDNWNNYSFAVLQNGKLIGCIMFSVSRALYYAHHFTAINFSGEQFAFGTAIQTIVDDIFNKYNFNKLTFSVIVGNPIEKTYDKMVEKYGGRIVGIFKNHTKVLNGDICDMKHYEITKDDYLQGDNNNFKDVVYMSSNNGCTSSIKGVNQESNPHRGLRAKMAVIDDAFRSVLQKKGERKKLMKSSRVLKRKKDSETKAAYKKAMSGKRYNPIKEKWFNTIETVVKYKNRTEERKLERKSEKLASKLSKG